MRSAAAAQERSGPQCAGSGQRLAAALAREHLHHSATLQLLGERGLLARADFFAVNKNGETPLQLAQRVAAMKSLKAAPETPYGSLAALVSTGAAMCDPC